MDKKLELRLIENGFNTQDGVELSGMRPIKRNIVNLIRNIHNPETVPLGMLLFEGLTDVEVNDELGESLISGPIIEISERRGLSIEEGLLINSPQVDSVWGGSSHLTRIHKKYSLHDFFKDEHQHNMEFSVENLQGFRRYTARIKIQLRRPNDTKVMYFRKIDKDSRDHLFWIKVAELFGLELSKEKGRYETNGLSGGPQYTAIDKKSGIVLSFERTTEAYGNYLYISNYYVKVNFPHSITSQRLRNIIDAPDIKTLIDGQRVTSKDILENGKPLDGVKSLEAYCSGHGGALVEYVSRILPR